MALTSFAEDDLEIPSFAKQEVVMKHRVLTLCLVLVFSRVASATAGTPGEDLVVPEGGLVIDGGDLEMARADDGSCLDPSLEEGAAPSLSASPLAAAATAAPQATPARRPVAFEYSDGYRTRLKIHKYASFATLPLIVAQFAVGQKLYDGNASDGTRSLHTALAASTGVLFGVNTVTGVWTSPRDVRTPTTARSGWSTAS
jgi:hypothetical protein